LTTPFPDQTMATYTRESKQKKLTSDGEYYSRDSSDPSRLSVIAIRTEKNTYNGAGGHVLHETAEEGLGGEVSVVLLEDLALRLFSGEREGSGKINTQLTVGTTKDCQIVPG